MIDKLKGTLLKTEPPINTGVLKGDLLVFKKINATIGMDNSSIENNKKYIDRLNKEYPKYFLSDLLGGETELNHENGDNIFMFSKEGKKTFNHKKIEFSLKKTHGKFIDTGADYIKLHNEVPNERYKFYFSLDLSTNYKKQKGEEFFLEIINLCKKYKLSFGYKTESHNYDNFLIYTWHKNDLVKIIKNLYIKYEGCKFFNSVPHFFQGKLKGINEKHIGFVQEPVGGLEGNSHSSRMYSLGKLLDAGKSYEESCLHTGINSEEPWKITN